MKPSWKKAGFAGLVCLMGSVLLLSLLHHLSISRGSTSFIYARLRDVAVVLISTGMCVHNLAWFEKDQTHKATYVIRASLFVIIGVIHFLSLLWGGLLC